MARARILFILVLVFLSPFAMANGESLLEKKIYEAVLQQCDSDSVTLEHSYLFVDSMKSSFKSFMEAASFNSRFAQQYLKDKGLSPTTSTILNSTGLHLALRDCYGHDEDKKKQFVLSLITADVLGGAVGGAQAVVSFVLGGRLIQYVLHKSLAIFKATRFGKNLNPAHERLHLGVLGTTLVVGLTTPQALSLYEKKKNSDRQNKAEIERAESFLNDVEEAIVASEQSNQSACRKTQEIYELSQLGRQSYINLNGRTDADHLLAKHKALYDFSLSAHPCVQ